MKRFIALTVVVFASTGLLRVAFAGPVSLSDGSKEKMVQPTAPVPECTWTGFYIGAQLGHTWGDLSWDDLDTEALSPGSPPVIDTSGPSNLVEQNPDGFFGGGQVGGNYQIGMFVLGAEGSFTYSDAKANSVLLGEFNTDIFNTHNDWLGTIGGRLGIAWNKFLFYGKAGGGFAHMRYSQKHHVPSGIDDRQSFEVAHTDTFSGDEWRIAPLVGGGIEYMFNCHWSAKVEYNHLFLGRENFDGTMVETDTGPEPETFSSDLSHDSVHVGLNYKFW